MNITLTVTLAAVIVLFLAVLYILYLTAGVQKKLNEITSRTPGEKAAPKKDEEKHYREANILYVQIELTPAVYCSRGS